MSEERAIPQEVLGQAIQEASANGHLAIVKLILSKSKKINQKALDKAVLEACENGHLPVIEFLLGDAKTADTELLESCLKIAAGKGHVAIIKFLFRTRRKFRSFAIDAAFTQATLYGHIEALKCLFAKYGYGDWFASVFNDAAANGHLHLITSFLSENRAVREEQLKWAIEAAVRHGHIEIVRFLMGRIRDVNQKWLASFIQTAVLCQKLEIAKFLLSEDRTINPRQLAEIIIIAASRGFLSLVEFLLSKGPILASAKNTAQIKAFGPDREGIRDLLQRTSVLSAEQEAAMQAAEKEEWDLNLSDVNRHPLDYLKKLAEQGLPAMIYVLNDDRSRSEVVDRGGVTKQFLTSLCDALIKNEHLRLSSQGLPMAQIDQEHIYTHLGRLVSLIYASNKHKIDKILTGHLFNPWFLQIVKAIAHQDEKTGLRQLCVLIKHVDPDLKAACDLLLEPTLEHKNAYLLLMGAELAEEISPDDDPVVKEAQAYIYPFYQAAYSFLAGVQDSFGVRLKKAQIPQTIEPGQAPTLSPDLQALATSFQGEPITAQKTLMMIRLKEGEFSAKSREILQVFASNDREAIEHLKVHLRQEQPDIQSKHFIDKLEWLMEAIALNDGNLPWLQKFIFSITGKKASLPGMTLHVQPQEGKEEFEEGSFSMRTCINTLVLPEGEIKKTSFMEALDSIILSEHYNTL